MPTANSELPVLDADNLVGVVWIFARSEEPRTVALYQVICPLQGEPTAVGHLEFCGRFTHEDLLTWAYEGRLCDSGTFEAPGFWAFMAQHTGLNPADMIPYRPMLGWNAEALEAVADMEAEHLAALLPTLPRAA